MAPPAAGNFLKPSEAEWREAFDRLSERFPTVPGGRIAQALRQHGGHAGGAAAVLRDQTGFTVKEADPDDVEHVSTLLSSPPMFKHACKEQFRKFDINKDGVLDWDEVKQLVHNLYDEFGLQLPAEGALQAFFYATDENQDGVLSEREFRKFFEMWLRYAFFDHIKLRKMVEKGQTLMEQRGANAAKTGDAARNDSQQDSRASSASDTIKPDKAKDDTQAYPAVRGQSQLTPLDSVKSASRRSSASGYESQNEKRRHRENGQQFDNADAAGAMRCIGPNGVAYRSTPVFQDRKESAASQGETVKVLEHWIRTPDGWLPVSDQQGRLLFESASGNADHRSEPQRKHVSIQEKRQDTDRSCQQSASLQSVDSDSCSLKPSEEEWRPVFDRLTERFPDIGRDKIVQALRDNDGHAGKAASTLRQL